MEAAQGGDERTLRAGTQASGPESPLRVAGGTSDGDPQPSSAGLGGEGGITLQKTEVGPSAERNGLALQRCWLRPLCCPSCLRYAREAGDDATVQRKRAGPGGGLLAPAERAPPQEAGSWWWCMCSFSQDWLREEPAGVLWGKASPRGCAAGVLGAPVGASRGSLAPSSSERKTRGRGGCTGRGGRRGARP